MADTASVSNSSDWASIAPIAGIALMSDSLLVSSSLAEVVNHQSLESLSGVRMNFFS